MSQFRSVGLMGRVGSAAVLETLVHLRELLRARGLRVVVEREVAEHLDPAPGEVRGREDIGRDTDLVIVVGGDGSLLGAARSLAPQNAPVLGVNRGRLGFLTDISPQQLEAQLDEVLAGRYLIESRFLLDVAVTRGDEVLASSSSTSRSSSSTRSAPTG